MTHKLLRRLDATQLDLGGFVKWSLSFPDPYNDPIAAADQGRRGFAHLPLGFQNALNEFSNTPYSGVLLVTGLPISADLPPTPTKPVREAGVGRVGNEGLLFSIASAFGNPYSYREWEGGLLLHNKYPIRQHATSQVGTNNVLLQMHTEKAFRDVSPDYVALLCLRGDPAHAAITHFCDLRRIIEQFPSDAQRLLRTPLYAFRTDSPRLVMDGIGYTAPHAIVQEHQNRAIYQYVDDLSALNDEAKEVLDKLRTAIGANTTGLHLNAGDLLVMDNSHIVHGRSAFRPNYDGRDRWLQRLMISHRLNANYLCSTGHLIPDSCFSECSSEHRAVQEHQRQGGANF
ncbi:TauD/TfdA family dioxygenase [Bradyrhizobium neotropicale]|uniref:TauD/TfdA-like domain-containing protein n=1 Tax=Bradyrhizobium neotropicale TaxID=1497615 RepID=A0A176Z879_9BRAD|nr:TauD/TfdA family dioxygenase [Bradyrhizobium neotropicale]OAF16919.1 hypothetical protein AXW67_00140 [Bradyrhizobium neotropicale]